MIAEIEDLSSLTRTSRSNTAIKLLQPGAAAAHLVVRALELPARRSPARFMHNAIPVHFSETRFTPRIVSRSQTH